MFSRIARSRVGLTFPFSDESARQFPRRNASECAPFEPLLALKLPPTCPGTTVISSSDRTDLMTAVEEPYFTRVQFVIGCDHLDSTVLGPFL